MFENATEVQLSYLAGIVDGEGYVGIGTTNGEYFSPVVTISNSSRELLEYLQLFAGGRIYHNAKATSRMKSSYHLTWGGAAAVEFCSLLLPYLFLKKPQAEIVAAFSKCKRNGKNGRLTDEESLNQAIAYVQVKALNKKGPAEDSSEDPTPET